MRGFARGTAVGYADVHAGRQEQPSRSQTPGGSEESPGYSWLEDYLVRLNGKEARQEYYGKVESRPYSGRSRAHLFYQTE